MKPQFLLIAALMVALLQGCIVKSLHPFFRESDVVFDRTLLSTWVDQNNDKWTIVPYKDKPNAYEMHWREEEGNQDIVFLAHLFKLQGELYLDVMPLTDHHDINMPLFEMHLLPAHSVAKVVMLSAAEVQIKWFDEDWLRMLFDQNKIKIAHEEVLDETPKDENDKWYVLTASTAELQKFIIKYGHEAAAFSNDNSTWLRLKRAI
jgi:hypothetical protein